MRDLQVSINAAGPVSARFMNRNVPEIHTQSLSGPIGSGKTTAALMKSFKRAPLIPPSRVDGIRRYSFVVVRDTYRNIWKSVIPSWFKRIPRDVGKFVGSNNNPATHNLLIPHPSGDGTMIDYEIKFLAVGEMDLEAFYKGFEPTDIYHNEGDTMARLARHWARSRVGRYPDKDIHGAPEVFGFWEDFNINDVDNSTYEQYIENLQPGWEYYAQPGAFEPGAENWDNLPARYYENMMQGMPEWMIDRLIHCKWGYSRAGKPVYPEYSDRIHVAPAPLKPIKGIKIGIGLDAGRTPSAVLGQKTAHGQAMIFDEFVKEDMGAKRFGRALREYLDEHYPGFEFYGVSDPASDLGNDTDEATWTEIVMNELDFNVKPAPTNNPTPRQEAVRQPLMKLLGSDMPGIIICPKKCPILRKGFNSGYRIKRIKSKGGETYAEVPDKNEYSHPHDALQYLMLMLGNYAEIMGRRSRASMGHNSRHAAPAEYDPYAY